MRKKIAVLYPAFLGGGAEACCLWIMEALKDEYDLTLFTLTNFGFAALNDIYGTELTEKDIKVMCPFPMAMAPAIRFIALNNIVPYSLFHHLLMKYFKFHKTCFDLPFGGFNEMDFGKRGIQYVHCPGFVLGSRYYNLLSGFSFERMKDNITIANSDYTARMIKKVYNIETDILYPTARECSSFIPWETREDGFVYAGRISMEKEIDKAVRILKLVRGMGYDTHLHIIGTEGKVGYEAYIRNLAKKNSNWVFFKKRITTKEYCQMLATHKYLINPRLGESFGIVILEAVASGLIPFVSDMGGQPKIIGQNENIIFHSEEDAARKILAVLSDEKKQEEIRSSLLTRATLFSKEKFMTNIRNIVAKFFARQDREKT